MNMMAEAFAEPTSSRRWRRICEARRALRVVEIVRDTFTEHRSIGQTLGEWDAAGEGKNQALRRILGKARNG